MTARTFSLPPDIETKIDHILSEDGLSLANCERLASDVQALANHFTVEEGRKTPWEKWAAYLVYYFPLNLVRLQSVLKESFVGFPWDKVDSIIDFGSGPGTAHAALENSTLSPKPILAIETNARAVELHRRLRFDRFPCSWSDKLPAKIPTGTLGIFSYSLLEEPSVEKRLGEFDHLLIVTPSTRRQSRQLLEIRKRLSTEGYSSWAPCTHQGSCPLLDQSEKDWCHDRIAFTAPDWYLRLESHLPFYNHSLTFSYWFASRTERAPQRAGFGRLIGDTLFERGKVRQLICRGPDREFLAWLTRHGTPEPIPRGTLIEIPDDAPRKGNEIRLSDK